MFGIPDSDHGAARRSDLAEALGERTLRGAIRDKVLIHLWRGVIIDARRALDPLTRAAAAVLAGGPEAVLSYHTAAWLHGCTAAQSTQTHVTVPYSVWVRSKQGLVVHHDRFDTSDVTRLQGLPVLSLDLVLADLLCTEERWKALAYLDQALAEQPPRDVADFRKEVDRRLMDRDDRRGIRNAEALIALGTTGAESPQESRLRLTIVDDGFPIPVTQHPIVTLRGELLYRLDLAWPALRIGVEYDGYEAHEGREDRDAERDRRLADRGWHILRVRKDELADPVRFLAELRQVFRDRGYRFES
ncbi:hypothetical protein GCM10027445_62800 [Amycolatopsis endophytica]|uniref:Very-short-patch-repair endonuclease n=1 Tax=Amycolatopsis endophytica TaxID=860233 RepID=A0A853AY97_9PSEU|nr:DUF559 domain-containing protein [Amycolatopsis endophytica]NYI87609.1 very-short-patch-repair endonuclease [Amycolatopsis endophytica]